MFWSGDHRGLEIATERLVLRLPLLEDFEDWSGLRRESREFLTPWEPRWAADHLTREAFKRRVAWANRSIKEKRAYPFFLIRKRDEALIGAVTLDNVRRGPSMAVTVGYWTGERYARRGYMREALSAARDHAFRKLDVSRVEAACLPENLASRKLLEKCAFKYEGVAQAYLQINGRWRDHVLYASLREDRRGPSEAR